MWIIITYLRPFSPFLSPQAPAPLIFVPSIDIVEMKLSTFACVALSGFAIALPSFSMEVEVDITAKGGDFQEYP